MKRSEVLTNCSKCGNDNGRINQRYCKSCHSAYMRENRLKHSQLNNEQKLKSNARSYANVYKRRGILIPMPCQICSNSIVEMHHSDYNKPLDITWLCRMCHLDEHHSHSIT